MTGFSSSDETIFVRRNFTARQKLGVLALAWAAFGLRLVRLGAQSLWFDETLSALFASRPLTEGIQLMLQEGLHHSPLYYILLRPFAANGFSEFSLRFLSVALGVLAVPLMAQAGRVLVSPTVGLMAALLLTVNPFHLWYSQEARMYTLLMACALGAMLFFARNLRASRPANWLAMAFFVAVGVNTHHFAFFIPLVQFIFLILTLRRNFRLLRWWVAAQALAGLSLLPWALVVLNRGQFYLSSASVRPPAGADLLLTLWNFSLGYTVTVTVWVVFALLVISMTLLVGLAVTRRRQTGLLLGLWALLPPLLTWLLSWRLPMYLDRYISLSLPPFLILVATGLHSLRAKWGRWAAFGLVTAAMLAGVARVYFDDTVYYRADWRGLSRALAQIAAPTDVVAPLYAQSLAPLSFYFDGQTTFEPIVILHDINLPPLPAPDSGAKLILLLDYPNDSSHLAGHCQPFDIVARGAPPEVIAWREGIRSRLSAVREFPCLRLEIYR